jgi:hypothetical protein
MPWFNRSKVKEPWQEEEDNALVGDIEIAHRIRDICNSATSSAEKLAGFVNRPSDKNKKFEADRYDNAKKRALELAKQISDELLRDTAVRQILNLCICANDVETAAVLIDAIQTEKIRREVLNDHPSLR